MLVSAFRSVLATLAAVLVALGAPTSELSASNRATDGSAQTVRTVDDDTTRPTINEFFPEERSLTDCLNNSIPLPNCGSDARGGWAQGIVLLAILGGLALIGWRIWAGSRRTRVNRMPDATSVRDGDGGAPAP
jgi:hypothetical protein